MRFGKTLLFGMSFYAMRMLLRRARSNKVQQPAPPGADFADTQPNTRWVRSGDDGVRESKPR
jgi:hypothetical protein